MCGSCEKKDDFIGQTFPTPKCGVSTVVGISDRKSGSNKIYQLTCSICSEDKELFPNLFESQKTHLVNGKTPCGCALSPRWSEYQIGVIVNRICKQEGLSFNGFVGGEYKNAHTKLKISCPIHGEFEVSYHNFVNGGNRCPDCGVESSKEKQRNPEAENNVNNICKQEGFLSNGFIGGEYKNKNTKLKISCPIHGEWNPSYHEFVNHGNRCPSCAEYGYQPAKPGHLYVTNWINKKKDTNEFFKIGITNFLEQRIKQQAHKTSYKPRQLIVFKFEDGSIPRELERLTRPYRQDMSNPIITQDEFGDGTTEILQNWIDIIKILPELIDTIRQMGYTPEIEVGKRLYNKLIKLDKSDMVQAILDHLYK